MLASEFDGEGTRIDAILHMVRDVGLVNLIAHVGFQRFDLFLKACDAVDQSLGDDFNLLGLGCHCLGDCIPNDGDESILEGLGDCLRKKAGDGVVHGGGGWVVVFGGWCR